MPQALKPLSLIQIGSCKNFPFPIISLWGNKNWLPSMKVKKLKIVQNKSGWLQMLQPESHQAPSSPQLDRIWCFQTLLLQRNDTNGPPRRFAVRPCYHYFVRAAFRASRRRSENETRIVDQIYNIILDTEFQFIANVENRQHIGMGCINVLQYRICFVFSFS